MTKYLFRTQAEAEKYAKESGYNYYSSSCDVDTLDEGADDEMQSALNDAMGTTQCYRNNDNCRVICGWWE